MVRVRARQSLVVAGLVAWLVASAAQAQLAWPPPIDVPGGPPPIIELPVDAQPVTVVADPTEPVSVVEDSLDGIYLGATFREVLTRTYLTEDGRRIMGHGGVPHYMGPAVENPEKVFLLFQKAPPQPDPVVDPAAAPPGGGMPVGAAGDGQPRFVADPAAVPLAPEAVPLNDYVIWIYLGHGDKPDWKAPWVTYVMFERMTGKVAGINVRATGFMRWPASPSARPGPNSLTLKTSVGVLVGIVETVVRPIMLGTRMADVVNRSKLGWPDPLGYNESAFFLNYPKYQFTLTVGGATRKVEGISVGVPLMVVRDPEDDKLPVPTAPIGIGVGGTGIKPGPGGALPAPGGTMPGPVTGTVPR